MKAVRFLTYSIFFYGALVIPTNVAQAQNLGAVSDTAGAVLNIVSPVLVSFAVIFFLYGLAVYLLHGDSEEVRTKGKQFMVWGIIALFVIASMWGFVFVLINTFGVDIESAPARGVIISV